MKCDKCNKDSYILELSRSEEYGWLCKDCATETNTALNLFMEKDNEIENKGDDNIE